MGWCLRVIGDARCLMACACVCLIYLCPELRELVTCGCVLVAGSCVCPWVSVPCGYVCES